MGMGSLSWDFFLQSSGELLFSTRHPNVSKSLPPLFSQTPLVRGKIIFKALRSRKKT